MKLFRDDRKATITETTARGFEVSATCAAIAGPGRNNKGPCIVRPAIKPSDAVSVAETSLRVTGQRTPKDASAVLSANLARIRGCYAEGRARDPALKGSMDVRLDVSKDGRVTALFPPYHPTALPDLPVSACVLSVLRSLTFRGGPASIWMSYRFDSAAVAAHPFEHP